MCVHLSSAFYFICKQFCSVFIMFEKSQVSGLKQHDRTVRNDSIFPESVCVTTLIEQTRQNENRTKSRRHAKAFNDWICQEEETAMRYLIKQKQENKVIKTSLHADTKKICS